MLSVDALSPERLVFLLDQHRAMAYPVLFLGAFLETLIPFSLVVYGEIFFIAGSVLAGIGKLDIWSVAAVLYIGAILGDNASYWLGRKFGMSLFQTLARQPVVGRYFREELTAKGVSFFRRRGDVAVFLARLCGPFSWVIPAFAGAFKLRYERFVFFNTFGIVLGIGEFLVVGYLFGNNIDKIIMLFKRFGIVAPLVVMLLISLFVTLRLWAAKREL